MPKITGIDWIFLALLVIGGINWGLIGLFNFNLVAELFGAGTALANIVYILVGVAAAYVLASFITKQTRRDRVT